MVVAHASKSSTQEIESVGSEVYPVLYNEFRDSLDCGISCLRTNEQNSLYIFSGSNTDENALNSTIDF